MNLKTKIAAGTIAGLLAGATLVGAAFAAPRSATAPVTRGYGMMRALGTAETTVVADMNAFMNRFRASNGTIDFNRMHSAVVNGTVTMPRVGTAGRGANMMSGYRTGTTMMGSTY